MPLHLYPDVYASGSVPPGWVPTKSGTIKYPVRNPAVRRYLRQLVPGRWRRVTNRATAGTCIILNTPLAKWPGSIIIRTRRAYEP
jgi:hypothetical protein